MFIKSCLLILPALLPEASVYADDYDPYALPPSKAFVKACKREALTGIREGLTKNVRCIVTEIIGWNTKFKRVTVRSGLYSVT